MRVRLPGRLRVGERRAHAALAGEVVELLRPDVADERAQRAGVADVAPHDDQPLVAAEEPLRRVAVAHGCVHRPALREQASDEVPAVLAGRARHDGGPRLHRRACAESRGGTLPPRVRGRPLHVRGAARRHRRGVRAGGCDDPRRRPERAGAGALCGRAAREGAPGRRPGLHRGACRAGRGARRRSDHPARRPRPSRACGAPRGSRGAGAASGARRRSRSARTSTRPRASSSATALPTPRTWLPDEVPDDVAFPVLVKARRGFGSRHIYRAADRDELAFFLRLHDRRLDGAADLRGRGVLDRRLLRPREPLPRRGAAHDDRVQGGRVDQGHDDQGRGADRARAGASPRRCASSGRRTSSASASPTARCR